MVDFSAELKAAIKEWAIDTLPYDQTNTDLCAELNAKDARELLIVYHNWMFRHIYKTPRQVHFSGAYLSNAIFAQKKADLDALTDKIKNGEELKPHLSERVETVIEPGSRKLNQRRDLDLMLIEWEVHHLHISQEMQQNGFVKRDGPLLFAVFHSNDAYVLDVMTHKDFNRDHILKILADEWPDAKLIHEIKAGPGEKIELAVKHTEDDRNKLRKIAVNTLVEIGDRVFKPAGGMTTAGTAIRASMAADKVMIAVDKLASALENRPNKFQKLAQQYGSTWPAVPTFEFGLLEPRGLGFKELSTGFVLPVA